MLNPILRRLAAGTATAVVLTAVSATEASAAVSIDPLPESAPIIEKLYVPVAVTFTCNPTDQGFSPPSVFIRIRQVVSGKQIASGEAFLSGPACDGSPHVATANVFPAGEPLFKKGDAVVEASVNVFPGGFASVGLQTIRLR